MPGTSASATAHGAGSSARACARPAGLRLQLRRLTEVELLEHECEPFLSGAALERVPLRGEQPHNGDALNASSISVR